MYDAIFDPAFYGQRHGLGDRGSLKHFIARGDRLGLDPGPYFSTRYYKQRYPDWQVGGAATAAADFLQRIAAGEMRQPHPLIDPAYYLARYPDLAGLGAAAALHFMAHGDAEVRAPSVGFDADFYQRCYLALDQRQPFRHFITEGQQLGHLPRPDPRSQAESSAAMAQAMAGRDRPFLLCAHDAQPAGVPLLTLDLAAALADRSWQPVFLLHRGGPLLDRFRALGPVFLLAEGWDLRGLAQGLAAGTPTVVNTAAAAGMAADLALAGHPCLVLIHEMADYLRAQDLLGDLATAQAAGARLIVSMPSMAAALAAELGPLAALRPGIKRPPAPLAAFRRARRWRKAQSGPVFISAGHAGWRKGFDLFLEAAQALRVQHPEARFIWLGALDRWARALADQALATGLALELPGFAADSLAWYRAADVYLLTSRQDPGPTTVIHAAAVGTPFVGYAADIGIIGMTDGIGQFIAPGDRTAFVAAATAAARAVSRASRLALRRHIRAETALEAYVDGVLAQLMAVSEDAAT